MTKIKVFLLCIFLLFCAFSLYSVFQPKNELIDSDSESYFYLWKSSEVSSWYAFQRPPLFPLILRITHLENVSLFLPLQYLSRACAIVLLSYVVFRYTRSFWISGISSVVAFLNLQLSQSINYLIPEIQVNFLLMLHFYVVYKWLKNPTVAWLFALVLSVTVLTFMKPIFQFYPVVFICIVTLRWVLMVFQKRHFDIDLKKIIIFGALFSLIYLLPIHLYSQRNLRQHGMYAISGISEFNLFTKVMHYGLQPKGELSETDKQLQMIILSHPEAYDVFALLEPISKVTPSDQDMIVFLGTFSRRVIKQNLVTFVTSSLAEREYIETMVPHVPYEFNHDIFVSSDVWYGYKGIYDEVWEWVIWSSPYTFLLVTLVSLGYMLQSKSQALANQIGFFSIYVGLTWVYGVVILIFTAYGDYVRLRSIFDDCLVIVLALAVYYIALWLNPPRVRPTAQSRS